MTTDPHDLARFEAAQAPVYGQALAELRAGRKRSHWMWFIFPQIAGLGMSAMSRRYAIGSLEEARAYLAHDVLGPRLHACTAAACAHRGMSARAIFGVPDDAKFRSCMTLFGVLDPAFGVALEGFFEGLPDTATLALLGADKPGIM